MKLKAEFDSVFSNEQGCLKDFKVRLPADKTATLEFCEAHSIPYSLNGRFEKELD